MTKIEVKKEKMSPPQPRRCPIVICTTWADDASPYVTLDAVPTHEMVL